MNLKALENTLNDILEPVAGDLGVSLEYLELTKMRGKFLLRVFIDKEGGVTLDDCERVSREAETVLDVEDPIPYSYTLEVSSPGLDRPLRNPDDFKKFSGKMARVTTSRPIENQTFFIGEITNAGDTDITLRLPKERVVTIPHDLITRARLEVTY